MMQKGHYQVRCLRNAFFFSSRRRHTRGSGDWSSDVCSSDLTTTSLPPIARSRAISARSTGHARWRRKRRRPLRASQGRSKSSGSGRWATSATCCSRSPRTCRCSSGSTGARTSRRSRTRTSRKLYEYCVNEVEAPDGKLIADMASDYYRSGFEIKPMLIRLFLSPQFMDPSNYFKRYAWPVEFVVRSIKEMGWTGFSVNDTLNPLISMRQQLFEPPHVAGWDLGQSWFTSGAMLARM